MTIEALEWKSNSKNSVVIVDMEMSRSDLESAAEVYPQSFREVKVANHEPRGYEDLCLSIVGAVLEMAIIHFHIRPKLLRNVVLECIVPGIRPPDLRLVCTWKTCPERALNINRPKPFP